MLSLRARVYLGTMTVKGYSAFPFLFSGYFCSIDACIVFGRYNQFSRSIFFMLSSSLCIDTSMLSSMLATPRPTSFFGYIQSVYIIFIIIIVIVSKG